MRRQIIIMIIVWLIIIICAMSIVFYFATINSQEIDQKIEICTENNGDYYLRAGVFNCVIGETEYNIVDTNNGWRLVKI